jgi:hypothetical protein
MAKTEFKLAEESKKITAAVALKDAKQKDLKNANFHIPAETGAVLTLTGDFYSRDWTRGTDSGTMLLAEAKSKSGKAIQIPFGFFRTKELLQEDGVKKFEACFDKNATFEEIVSGITKDKKIKVCRSGYIYPGRSSSRDVDTVIWAE